MYSNEAHPSRCRGDHDALTRGLSVLSRRDASVEDLCEALAGSSQLEAASRLAETELEMPAGALRTPGKALLVFGPWAILCALAQAGVAREADRDARIAVAIGCRELGRQLGLPGIPELYLSSLIRQAPSRLGKSTFEELGLAARRLAAVSEVGSAQQVATELHIPLCRVRGIRQMIRSETEKTLSRLDRILGR